MERLANSGLVEEVSLSSRPLNRLEAARIIAQAIRKIEAGEGSYGLQNPLLEDQLETLVQEFQWELQRMGAYPFEAKGEVKWYSIKPLDMVEAKVGYAEDPYLLENSMADNRAKGFNLRLGGASRVELADYVSLYIHPEYRYDDEENKGYLLQTYGKVTLANIELEIGRDSLWWGPGYHGSLLLSNHALPLDLIKLSSGHPFQLPWIFRYLGFFDLSAFLSRLEENRDFPHAKLLGMRLVWSPFSFLELGASRVIQFNGEGRPSYDFSEYVDMIWGREENRDGDLDNNQIASLDATLTLRSIGRYFPLANSLVLYGEYGGEDMTGEESGVPFPYKPGYLVGILLQDLFTAPGLDLRAEYAKTDKVWYRHNLYKSGYTYKGVVLGHHMGGDADDLYLRLSYWFNKNWQIAFDFDQQRSGRSDAHPIRERYIEPSILLFRPRDIPIQAALAYRFVRTENAGHNAGETHDNHLVRLDLSFYF